MFGIQHETIQQKFLDSKNLTFQAAVEIIKFCELAQAVVKSLNIGEETTVNQVRAMKVEKAKTEKYAYVSKPKEEIRAWKTE